ncbi:hypothetical protein BDY17DRAFT_313606 [Neohortaea acidophila]|uniref:Uncharacterized protein n=1 Tax=Neohortaea acidophila TaxID=245834 RepID=A0A6A6PGY9_9PEZI|nr:uncharacterized protein BDY17DRAFT_313606 [Neohortaea acidophila]KAF2479001.1 hypothetical protein BDY17DRAFT_313606 [Neohortaea acidophila]
MPDSSKPVRAKHFLKAAELLSDSCTFSRTQTFHYTWHRERDEAAFRQGRRRTMEGRMSDDSIQSSGNSKYGYEPSEGSNQESMADPAGNRKVRETEAFPTFTPTKFNPLAAYFEGGSLEQPSDCKTPSTASTRTPKLRRRTSANDLRALRRAMPGVPEAVNEQSATKNVLSAEHVEEAEENIESVQWDPASEGLEGPGLRRRNARRDSSDSPRKRGRAQRQVEQAQLTRIGSSPGAAGRIRSSEEGRPAPRCAVDSARLAAAKEYFRVPSGRKLSLSAIEAYGKKAGLGSGCHETKEENKGRGKG